MNKQELHTQNIGGRAVYRTVAMMNLSQQNYQPKWLQDFQIGLTSESNKAKASSLIAWLILGLLTGYAVALIVGLFNSQSGLSASNNQNLQQESPSSVSASSSELLGSSWGIGITGSRLVMVESKKIQNEWGAITEQKLSEESAAQQLISSELNQPLNNLVDATPVATQVSTVSPEPRVETSSSIDPDTGIKTTTKITTDGNQTTTTVETLTPEQQVIENRGLTIDE